MSAVALLLELREAGVAVDVVEGRIRCRHRPGVLPSELSDRVRERRAEILALLADPDTLREAVARVVFDAAADGGAKNGAMKDANPGARICYACGHEYGTEVAVCPRCHPPARAPVGRWGNDEHLVVPGSNRGAQHG